MKKSKVNISIQGTTEMEVVIEIIEDTMTVMVVEIEEILIEEVEEEEIKSTKRKTPGEEIEMIIKETLNTKRNQVKVARMAKEVEKPEEMIGTITEIKMIQIHHKNVVTTETKKKKLTQ